LNYYKEHLEQFSPAYKKQFQEIKEGILYFDIMQTEVWSKMADVVEPGSQLAAESKWFETLAKKYPVVVNEKVKKTTLAKLQKN
jgi:DNA-directed RNA polymerase subunit F